MRTRAVHLYVRSARRKGRAANALLFETFGKHQADIVMDAIYARHREGRPTGRPTSRSIASVRSIRGLVREVQVWGKVAPLAIGKAGE